jgi:O-antigen/teichoic acid export membrane protein
MASSTYLRIGSQFIVFLVLARILGPEQFGLISYWMSVAMLASLPINYGFGIQLLRDASCAPERAVSVVADMFAAKSFLMIVVSLLAAFFSWQFADRIDILLLFMIMAIAESFIDFFNYVLRSLGHFGEEARLAFISSFFQFLLLLSIAFAFRNAVWVAFGYAASRIFTLLLTLRIVNRYMSLNNIGSYLAFHTIPRTLLSGFPYAADMGVSTLNSVLDNVILKQLADVRSVGVYQAGARLMLGGTTFATVISNVYLPKVSALDCDSFEYLKTIDKMNLMSICAGGILGLVFAFGNTLIVNILFGPDYQQLGELLPWFGLVLVLRYIAASCGVNLTASGHQIMRVIANGAYLACFLASSVLLISRFGTVGILMATTLATLVLITSYILSLLLNKRPCGITARSLAMMLIFVTPIIIKIYGGPT